MVNAPRPNSTHMIGNAATVRANAAGNVRNSAYSIARLSDDSAAASSPPRTWRDSIGSNAVPTAMPITPKGNCWIRSA